MPLRPLIALALLAGCSAAGTGDLPDADDGADAAGTTDDAGAGSPDLATTGGARDMATGGPADLTLTLPAGGNVGAKGGAVDRLYFAIHGDTRPMSCNDTAGYPTAIIDSIYSREAAANVEFTLDLGDHMFVCNGSLTTAQAQMGLYTKAAAKFPKTSFFTMGNHECSSQASYCYVGSNGANYTAFMQALKPISTIPYYTFDVTTQSGKATFVVLADNAWDNTEATWLESTLATADKTAKYTIIARHHPVDNTDLPTMMDEVTLIKKHKYSLFLTGHTHEYKRDTFLDPSGRTLRIGNGGAPPDNNFPYYGYATVLQGNDDRLYVTVYDEASGMQRDAWSVLPQ